MTTKVQKTSYRFGDLCPGDQFYLTHDSFYTYTVSRYGGAIGGYGQKKELSHNCEVIPVNKRRVAASKREGIKALAKEFGIDVAFLRGYYRDLVFETVRPYQPRIAIPTPDNPTELAALNALRACGLVHTIRYTPPYTLESVSLEIVSGDHNRLYL
jgi:hypothetical protein